MLIMNWVSAIDDQSIKVVINRKSGWAKIAMVHSFRVLLGVSYKDLSGETRDTDTNARIAGALVGAFVKLSGIHSDMVDKVLS
jgi:hypothetical protein